MATILKWLQELKKRYTRSVERLNTQESISDQDSLVYGKMLRQEIERTPFHIVGTEVEGYALTIGMNRLSPLLDSVGQVHLWLEDNKWNVMITCMIMILDTKNDIGKAVNDTLAAKIVMGS